MGKSGKLVGFFMGKSGKLTKNYRINPPCYSWVNEVNQWDFSMVNSVGSPFYGWFTMETHREGGKAKNLKGWISCW